MCYRDGFFDVVYANSVFSHLGEVNHLSWAQEYARILKPGGLAVVTTQAKHFLDFCADLRTGKRPVQNYWQETLRDCFAEPGLEEKFASGQLLYAPKWKAERPMVYGEAIVPKQYFQDKWGDLGFELLDWFEHPELLGQNRAVLRLRSSY
jgi:hypothetical protein